MSRPAIDRQAPKGAPKVVVLMSTFNGSKFVIAQIMSILEQLPPTGQVVIRDDGSSDNTLALIASVTDSRIQVNQGQNIGFGASFLTLLASVPRSVDLVMFSDQDDIWLPGKIQRAWAAIEPYGATPVLYCSAQQLVDESLNPIGISGRWPRGPSFAGALAENIVTGCTAALNRDAVALVVKAGVPPEVRFHDWWIYLVVSSAGHVLVDAQPTLLYRQHESNVIGRGSGWWRRHTKMLRFLWKNDWAEILVNQVAALSRCYGEQLTSDQKVLLRRYFRLSAPPARARWSLVFSPRRWRQHRGHELFFRGLLIIQIFKSAISQAIGLNRRNAK